MPRRCRCDNGPAAPPRACLAGHLPGDHNEIHSFLLAARVRHIACVSEGFAAATVRLTTAIQEFEAEQVRAAGLRVFARLPTFGNETRPAGCRLIVTWRR
jgi:hypothetical protein